MSREEYDLHNNSNATCSRKYVKIKRVTVTTTEVRRMEMQQIECFRAWEEVKKACQLVADPNK